MFFQVQPFKRLLACLPRVPEAEQLQRQHEKAQSMTVRVACWLAYLIKCFHIVLFFYTKGR